jgi:hypothetical protein
MKITPGSFTAVVRVIRMSASWTPVLRDAVRCKTEGGIAWAGRPAQDACIALQRLF